MNQNLHDSSRPRLPYLTPVALPGDRKTPGNLNPVSSMAAPPEAPLPLAGHLLLIDEAGADASDLRSMLVSEVLNVINVDSSVQAFLAARSGKYDVIVSRLNASLSNPFKAFDMLQSNGLIDDIPFIYLATESDLALARAAMDRGADDVITLPVADEHLRQAIAVRLRRWRTRSVEARPISEADQAMETPLSSRTVDAAVIVRGACQAYKRQRVRGTILLDVEKVRVASPITVLLKVILTLLQALDIHDEQPATLRISLKQIDDNAVLTVRTSASETELAPGLDLRNEYPERLEPIARAITLLGGTFEYGSHALYPAARVFIPGV